MPLSLHNIPGKESGERLQSLADYLEITDVLDKFPAQMSGGQQQRIAAAREMCIRDRQTGVGTFFICTWGYVSEKFYKGHSLRKEICDGTS